MHRATRPSSMQLAGCRGAFHRSPTTRSRDWPHLHLPDASPAVVARAAWDSMQSNPGSRNATTRIQRSSLGMSRTSPQRHVAVPMDSAGRPPAAARRDLQVIQANAASSIQGCASGGAASRPLQRGEVSHWRYHRTATNASISSEKLLSSEAWGPLPIVNGGHSQWTNLGIVIPLDSQHSNFRRFVWYRESG